MKPQDLSLDFRSGVPVYVQIVEQVGAHLASGNLKPGDQLPTVRQMAAELRVNFNTVARAYRMLDEAGLISTQQGRGTYILDTPRADQNEKIKTNSLESQIEHFTDLLRRQGFTPEEVETQMLKFVRAWRDGNLTDEEDTQ